MNQIQRVVFASGVGSMLEMYDFVTYGLVAVVLGQLFFPHQSHLVSVMSSFAVFASGFLARPLGSIFFGHFGDRFGRRNILILTIILMALASFLIAVVPTYQKIGVWAPLLLIIFRLMQGFAVGGEFAGAVTFVAEHAPENQRSYYTSWIFFFVNMGIVLASAVITIVSSLLSNTQFTNWGWRVLFIIGGLLAVIGFYVRQRISETPLFVQAKMQHELVKLPVAEIFTSQKWSITRGCGIAILASVFVGMILMFMPSYLTITTHIPLNHALFMNACSVLALSLLILFFGFLSDKLGRKIILLFGSIGLTLFSYPLFGLLNMPNDIDKFLGLLGLVIFGASLLGVFGATLAALFPTRIRYTCIAFSYNLPFAVLAGTAPVMSLYLIHHTGNFLAPGIYLAVAALITLLVVLSKKRW